MRVMLDALNPDGIPLPLPAGATMVAGYVDLSDRWPDSAFTRFQAAGAIVTTIARNASTNDGDFLDVEPGLATPAQAPGWVTMRRNAGHAGPIVYCSYADWSNVRQAFSSQSVAEPDYWVADYPGIGPNLYDGSIGHQYTDTGAYDISVMADYIQGIDMTSPQAFWEQTIPFTNADGTVVQVPAQTVLTYADTYAGKALNVVNDPTVGNAALLNEIKTLQTSVASLAAAVVKLTPAPQQNWTLSGTMTGTAQ